MNIPYLDLFKKIGAEYGMDWALLAAQCWQETRFDTYAVGRLGEQGLAQFLPETWAQWGEGDPFDPQDNIRAQARYLKWLIEQMDGDVWWGLVAFNWGIKNVKTLRERGGTSFDVPQEVWDYAEDILKKMWEIKDSIWKLEIGD